MLKFILVVAFIATLNSSECKLPMNLAPNLQPMTLARLQNNPDIMRNRKNLKDLCIYSIYFKEHHKPWNMLLLFNKKKPRGAFWFLPHDNENSAFDSAIYATKKYGGGFLAVVTGGKRNNGSIDPNRNFATKKLVGRCRPSPVYTGVVFSVIDYFEPKSMPYLSLHNNSNGHFGNGGRGNISILKNSATVHSYLAYKKISRGLRAGLKDEDSLIYIAGTTPKPPKGKLKSLLNSGLNVKYEVVTPERNDCSMSNFVVLGKGTTNYYNIEVEHGDTKTQKIMIDRLMKIIK
jgi:hypothetical protein